MPLLLATTPLLRRLALLSALGAAGLGCGSSPPQATPPTVVSASAAAVAVASPPSPEVTAAQKTPEEAAAAREGTGCEAKTQPRERAFCYLKSESEASLDPL